MCLLIVAVKLLLAKVTLDVKSAVIGFISVHCVCGYLLFVRREVTGAAYVCTRLGLYSCYRK